MRKLIIATMIFVLAGLSASYARGGMHGGGMHGPGSHALMVRRVRPSRHL